MKFQLLGTVVVLLVCASGAMAQAQPGSGVTPEMRTEANGFYQASDWAKAADAYEKIVAKEAVNFAARYRLGMSLFGLNKNAEAAAQIEKALTGAPNPVFALALARAAADRATFL